MSLSAAAALALIAASAVGCAWLWVAGRLIARAPVQPSDRSRLDQLDQQSAEPSPYRCPSDCPDCPSEVTDRCRT